MKLTLACLLLLFSSTSIANINLIDFKKIDQGADHTKQFDYVKQNAQYCAFWQPTWTYDINKDSLIAHLKNIYTVFDGLKENVELELLLGDIAHYLYNLDVKEYYDPAVNHYNKAIKLSPTDYRGHWFLGFHLNQSDFGPGSFPYFTKAQSLLKDQGPAEFWEEYAIAAYTVNMPTHCIYAMDIEKKILQHPGYFESSLGEVARKKINAVTSTASYKSTDIWAAKMGDTVSFISRPFGIKVRLDSTWQIKASDFKDREGWFLVKPSTIKNKAGRDIGYSILLFMRVPAEGEKLDDFVAKLAGRYKDKKSFSFSTKYPMQSWEIKDKTMYADVGGGHFHIIGMERNRPAYPGLLLEEAIGLPINDEAGKMEYYSANASKGRFAGKIYYVFILDTCEDIYDRSFELFKKMFERDTIIE